METVSSKREQGFTGARQALTIATKTNSKYLTIDTIDHVTVTSVTKKAVITGFSNETPVMAKYQFCYP